MSLSMRFDKPLICLDWTFRLRLSRRLGTGMEGAKTSRGEEMAQDPRTKPLIQLGFQAATYRTGPRTGRAKSSSAAAQKRAGHLPGSVEASAFPPRIASRRATDRAVALLALRTSAKQISAAAATTVAKVGVSIMNTAATSLYLDDLSGPLGAASRVTIPRTAGAPNRQAGTRNSQPTILND